MPTAHVPRFQGLSAPAGSLLAGAYPFISRARAFRSRVGGNLRQPGVAAAGIVARETMIGRLAEDHAIARRLASGLAAIDARLVETSLVQANIIKVDPAASGLDAAEWTSKLAASGVLVQPRGTTQLRRVTHRHVDAGAADTALSACAEVGRPIGGMRRFQPMVAAGNPWQASQPTRMRRDRSCLAMRPRPGLSPTT